jgi:hypothetical protein
MLFARENDLESRKPLTEAARYSALVAAKDAVAHSNAITGRMILEDMELGMMWS